MNPSAANQNRGMCVVLEGGEGAGKSTQAKFVRSWLEARGRRVIQTREPGGSPLAEAIRNVVLSDWEEGVPPTAELLLMYAARAAHMNATILPALAEGIDVVCDRGNDSSWAFQHYARGMLAEDLKALETMVLGTWTPDLVLIFDVDPAIGLGRAQKRGAMNRFDREHVDFAERVRAGFLDRAQRAPGRYRIVNAGETEDHVRDQVAAILQQSLVP